MAQTTDKPILGDANIASVAALLADPARVNILMALSDGRAFTASELAKRARVAPSTASAHLARLVEYSLITVEKQGRHRYFRLADPAIVGILESLALFAPSTPVRSLHDSTIGGAVRRGRTCYNHLAGMLGVGLTQALQEKEILIALEDGGYTLSKQGTQWFLDFGVNWAPLNRGAQLLVPWHIDWSERRHHLAGALGAAFMQRLFELDWIKRIPSSRAVRVTDTGQEALLKSLGMCWENKEIS